MYFTCEKNNLINTINIVLKAVVFKSSLPVLEGILIETDSDKIILKGSDTALSIKSFMPALVEEEGKVVLPARLLHEIIVKYPDGDISFKKQDNNSVSIECGKAKTSLQYMDHENFPDFPEMNHENCIKINGRVLKDIINQTIFATSLAEDKPILTGVLFEIEDKMINVVALDGYRLALRREKIEGKENIQLVIPSKSLKEASKIIGEDENMIDICFSEKILLLRMENTEVYTRLLEGDFVKYKNILPEEYKTRVKVEAKTLHEAIERASILAREGSNKNLIKLSISEDLIVVTANSEIGNAYEEVPIYLEGKDLDIAFNSKYITDVFKVLEDEEILMDFNTNVSPCVIRPETGDSYMHLILPVQTRG